MATTRSKPLYVLMVPSSGKVDEQKVKTDFEKVGVDLIVIQYKTTIPNSPSLNKFE